MDICRQSIIFETVAGVNACLAAIAADGDVALARIKNRMHPAFDAAVSAGFRNVALNLRIQSAEARRMGVHGHVCEVQLLLRQFAELKVSSPMMLTPAFKHLDFAYMWL